MIALLTLFFLKTLSNIWFWFTSARAVQDAFSTTWSNPQISATFFFVTVAFTRGFVYILILKLFNFFCPSTSDLFSFLDQIIFCKYSQSLCYNLIEITLLYFVTRNQYNEKFFKDNLPACSDPCITIKTTKTTRNRRNVKGLVEAQHFIYNFIFIF